MNTNQSSLNKKFMKSRILLCPLVCFLLLANPGRIKAQAVNVQDSLGLIDLYNSTGGTSWKHHNYWRTSAPLATWYGIRINDFGDVGTVNLANNNLTGAIPLSLGNFTLLDSLQLNDNHLSGGIPVQLGYLAWLSVLNLDNNQLTGTMPANLGSNRLKAVI